MDADITRLWNRCLAIVRQAMRARCLMSGSSGDQVPIDTDVPAVRQSLQDSAGDELLEQGEGGRRVEVPEPLGLGECEAKARPPGTGDRALRRPLQPPPAPRSVG
ncbi:MAG TPA: hypothetical protein DCP38_16925, partial [Acidobacteria bacterium]|nr:hypothetical protein [Acidobacteriota bacterium]